MSLVSSCASSGPTPCLLAKPGTLTHVTGTSDVFCTPALEHAQHLAELHGYAQVAWLAIAAAVVCIVLLVMIERATRRRITSKPALLAAVRARKAIYKTKLAAADPLGEEAYTRHDMMQHTVEALMNLEEEIELS